MRRWLTKGTSGLLLMTALILPPAALGQANPNGVTPVVERPTPVFPWVLALLSTLVILLILCVPSRKA